MPGCVIIFISRESVYFHVIEMQSIPVAALIYSQETVPVA